MTRSSRLGRLTALLSFGALLALVYLGGAASMHFQLPLSDFLSKAFEGGRQWFASQPAFSSYAGPEFSAAVNIDQPEKTYDGFTLYTTTHTPEARLLDMKGNVVHRWSMATARSWPKAPHVDDPAGGEAFHWDRCYLYPNGELLALCCKGTSAPYGYGLAKFDKDSQLLWGFSEQVHHDLDVGDDGRIYTLGYRHDTPAPPDAEPLTYPYMADYLLILGADGRELERVSLLEAFRDSPYFPLLSGGTAALQSKPPLPGQGNLPAHAPPQATPFPADVLHANSVRVLSPALAAKFPLFKAGQVLISFRSPSVLAVVDPHTHTVVWAARGIWQYQHCAEFLASGRILLFDNSGSPRSSRVIEYDPVTQAIHWCYSGENAAPFISVFRGGNQRLPNGNTLIVDSEQCRLVEVTPRKEIAWQWSRAAENKKELPADQDRLNFTAARRYGPQELPFLQGDTHARPRTFAPRDSRVPANGPRRPAGTSG